ncbi:MAG: DUF1549 and DUF1553 domain-containing protein [Planctomycetota bacterium]|nr:DUF1549 and DUF1553 domain-containing protein [Planctomycetota bacterium]
MGLVLLFATCCSAASPAQPQHWAFQPLETGDLPHVQESAWVQTAVDRYILAGLESANLTPNSTASRHALIRRISYDLKGLPPSPAEVRAFIADERPQAYARLVDEYLASPRYGERWGRHWLDVVRYADSNDLRAVGARHDITETYRYRDWVVRSLNHDLPYNRFMMNQVAGDLLPAPLGGHIHRDGIIATGMLAFGVWGAGDSDGEKMHSDMVDDMINVTTRAFLGLTVACARCHDHKFDPISQADYYALAGIFFSSEIAPPGTSAPWVQIPLVDADAIEQYNHLENQRKKTIADLKADRDRYRDRIYQSLLETYVPETPRYLEAAYRYLSRPPEDAKLTIEEFAARQDRDPAPHPGRILLMVGDAAMLRPGDAELAQHLRGRGHSVSLFAPARTTAEEQYNAALRHDLVLISESIAANSVRFQSAKSLKDVPRPILSFEPYMFPYAGWTGKAIHVDYGLTGVPLVAELGLDRLQHSITVHASGHPLTLGLANRIRVYEEAYTLGWGKPGEAARVIASADPAGQFPTFFVYEPNSKLFDRTTAPATRMGLFLGQQGLGNPLASESFNWGNLTRAGVALIDAAVEYAIRPDSISQPDPATLASNSAVQRPLRGDALAQWLTTILDPPQPAALPEINLLESAAWSQEGIGRWHTGPTTPYALVNSRDQPFDVPSLVANTFYGRILYAEGVVDAGLQRYQANKLHLTTDDGAPTDGIISLLFRAPRDGVYDFTIDLTNRVAAKSQRNPFFHIVVQNKLRDQGQLRGHQARTSLQYRDVRLAAGDAVEICASGGGETFPLAVMQTDVSASCGASRWNAAEEFHSPTPGSPILSPENPLPGNVWEYGFRIMQGEQSALWATMNPGLFQPLTLASETGVAVNGAPESGPDLNIWSTPATGRLAPRRIALHPGSRSDVGVEWVAPRDTRIEIDGEVADLQAIGDGVHWEFQYQPSGTPFIVASGIVLQGARQSLTSSGGEVTSLVLPVAKGDVLRLRLSAQKDAVADITEVSWRIRELDDRRQEWDLSTALLAQWRAPNTKLGPWRLVYQPVGEANTDSRETEQATPDPPPGVEPQALFTAWLERQGVRPLSRGADIPATFRHLEVELTKLLTRIDKNPAKRAEFVLASPVTRLYINVVADAGPFRFIKRNDKLLLPPAALAEIQRLRAAENTLVNNPTPKYPVAMGIREGGPKGTSYHGFNDARIHKRGHYAHLGAVVPRGVPGFLPLRQTAPIVNTESGRRQLAEWIAHPENPLPARVMVNRLWLHHFGAGLVRTPGNFGYLGEAPTHPQLLDYLAQQLIDHDWSLKQIHRELLLSATYQQSSKRRPELTRQDPTNQLWGRMPVRRLQAEAIRDTLLSVSQTLDLRMGGAVTRKREPDADALSYRRALYLMTNRSDKSGFRFLFDAADPNNVVDQRTVSTVASQSLYLMNHPFVLQLLPPMANFASRGLDPGSTDASLARQIGEIYLTLFARKPTLREQRLGISLIRRVLSANSGPQGWDRAWRQYCQVLLCTNELIYLN